MRMLFSERERADLEQWGAVQFIFTIADKLNELNEELVGLAVIARRMRVVRLTHRVVRMRERMARGNKTMARVNEMMVRRSERVAKNHLCGVCNVYEESPKWNLHIIWYLTTIKKQIFLFLFFLHKLVIGLRDFDI